MNLGRILSEKNVTIIDVREPYEFEMGHVEGSINIPLGGITSSVEKIKEMSKPIVLCCASGGRSGQATMFLNANGIKEAYNGGSWMTVDSAKMSV